MLALAPSPSHCWEAESPGSLGFASLGNRGPGGFPLGLSLRGTWCSRGQGKIETVSPTVRGRVVYCALCEGAIFLQDKVCSVFPGCDSELWAQHPSGGTCGRGEGTDANAVSSKVSVSDAGNLVSSAGFHETWQLRP